MTLKNNIQISLWVERYRPIACLVDNMNSRRISRKLVLLHRDTGIGTKTVYARKQHQGSAVVDVVGKYFRDDAKKDGDQTD